MIKKNNNLKIKQDLSDDSVLDYSQCLIVEYYNYKELHAKVSK